MNRALVKRAAAEHFLEGYLGGEIERKIESTPPELRAAAAEAEQPSRSVPDGCFVWIAHLLWVERMLEITPLHLTAEEAEGLAILKLERLRFQNEHPPCPHCGMPNERAAFHCRECFEKLRD